jgi:hypothetical protein
MVEQTAIRTQDEIVARIEVVRVEGDWLGFRQEVLISALDFEHASPFLNEGVTEEEWNGRRDADLEHAAKGYLEFAIGKIEDHRGISASRSVDKLTEYAWLLGRDDVVYAMENAHYPQYGAPKVKAFADGMGWPWPDAAALNRMAEGSFCEPGCESGCGS